MKRVHGRWWVERETRKAVLAVSKRGGRTVKVWLPKRSIDLEGLLRDGELWVDDWLLDAKPELRTATAER